MGGQYANNLGMSGRCIKVGQEWPHIVSFFESGQAAVPASLAYPDTDSEESSADSVEQAAGRLAAASAHVGGQAVLEAATCSTFLWCVGLRNMSCCDAHVFVGGPSVNGLAG